MSSRGSNLTEQPASFFPLHALATRLGSVVRRLLIGVFRGYQYLISPMLGNHCRFYPSCSQYAVDAIETHGAIKGCWMAVRRLLRCHPWHAGGFDPVPGKSDEAPNG